MISTENKCKNWRILDFIKDDRTYLHIRIMYGQHAANYNKFTIITQNSLHYKQVLCQIFIMCLFHCSCSCRGNSTEKDVRPMMVNYLSKCSNPKWAIKSFRKEDLDCRHPWCIQLEEVKILVVKSWDLQMRCWILKTIQCPFISKVVPMSEHVFTNHVLAI